MSEATLGLLMCEQRERETRKMDAYTRLGVEVVDLIPAAAIL